MSYGFYHILSTGEYKFNFRVVTLSLPPVFSVETHRVKIQTQDHVYLTAPPAQWVAKSSSAILLKHSLDVVLKLYSRQISKLMVILKSVFTEIHLGYCHYCHTYDKDIGEGLLK